MRVRGKDSNGEEISHKQWLTCHYKLSSEGNHLFQTLSSDGSSRILTITDRTYSVRSVAKVPSDDISAKKSQLFDLQGTGIMLLGGQKDKCWTHNYRYDHTQDKWSQVPSLPENSVPCSGCVLSNKVYVFGVLRQQDEQHKDAVFVLDFCREEA